jgi:Flp pilus assembly protein TadG
MAYLAPTAFSKAVGWREYCSMIKPESRAKGLVRRGALGADKSGNVIILFALTAPILFGIGGAALDYGNAVRIRAVEQSVSDATALLVAGADTPLARTEGFRLAEAQLRARLGDQSSTGGYRISGAWIDSSNYKLTISTTLKTFLVHLLPGTSREIEVSVSTVVNRVAPQYVTAPPTLTQLSPEAADYNRIYFYCYSSDQQRQQSADRGRRGITAIADNAQPPTDYSANKPPPCEANEAPSYMLRNVRNARTSPNKWDRDNEEVFIYYTDTVIDTGGLVQTMNLNGSQVFKNSPSIPVDTQRYPMLETIVCDSLSACVSQSLGGILPNNHVTHNPQTSQRSCEEGKFMYYGWEDRPGGDRDYDDIRVVVSCPKQVKVSDKKLKIVQ